MSNINLLPWREASKRRQNGSFRCIGDLGSFGAGTGAAGQLRLSTGGREPGAT